jgi:hypothetical protein
LVQGGLRPWSPDRWLPGHGQLWSHLRRDGAGSQSTPEP